MVRFSLRIPSNTYAALKKRAKAADRSVNYVIVQILGDVVDGDWIAEDYEDEDD